jgi:hypothetical protein
LLRRQALEGGGQHAPGFLLQDAVQRSVLGGRRLTVAFGKRLLPGLRRPDVVDRQVGGDPADPRPERPREVEAPEGLIRADERLLGHVVGHLVPADDPEGHAVDPPLVSLDDLLEGKQVSPSSLGQEVGLDRIHLP